MVYSYNFKSNKTNQTITLNTFKGVQVSSTMHAAYVKRDNVSYHYDHTNNTDSIVLACEHMLADGANLLSARIKQCNTNNASNKARWHSMSHYTADEVTRDILEHIKRSVVKIDDSDKIDDVLLNFGICGLFELNTKIDDYNARATIAERERAERERAEAERAERERERERAERERKQSQRAVVQAIKADGLTAEQLQAIQAILAQSQAEPTEPSEA